MGDGRSIDPTKSVRATVNGEEKEYLPVAQAVVIAQQEYDAIATRLDSLEIPSDGVPLATRVELLASRLEMVMDAFGATGREPPWISFKDRLPDQEDHVLVYRKRSAGHPPIVEIGQMWRKDLLLPETSFPIEEVRFRGFHWRPLPAGPGEKPADEPARDLPTLETPADLGPLRSIEGFAMPRVQLRYRCGKQGIATDDAPCAIVVLPAPKQSAGKFLCTATGTPEQVWQMTQVVMRYAKDTGVLDLAKAGAFGADTAPGGQGKIISDKLYGENA